jgi:hypothetical protein
MLTFIWRQNLKIAWSPPSRTETNKYFPSSLTFGVKLNFKNFNSMIKVFIEYDLIYYKARGYWGNLATMISMCWLVLMRW